MNKPIKILLGGALIAILMAVGGAINTHRLESDVRDLEEGEGTKSENNPIAFLPPNVLHSANYGHQNNSLCVV